MTILLTALGLMPIAYGFGPTTKLNYSVDVDFNGYIPILGGQEGKVEVKMPIRVDGLAPEGVNQQASGEITDFKIVFNGAPLPFTLDSVKEYFPKNTVSFSPLGKIVKNNAPNIDVPVKLPGLDTKRFPDITYLPVEFPEEGIEVGKKWSFSKSFGGSDVTYQCEVKSISDTEVIVDMAISQAYETFEDEAKNTQKDSKDAAYRVNTKVTGQGTATFDAKLKVIRSFKASAEALSKVTDLQSKVESDRKLTTVIDVRLQTGAGATTESAPSARETKRTGVAGWVDRVWNESKEQGAAWLSRAQSWMAMLQVGMRALPRIVPLPIDQWVDQIRHVLGG